jgi:hypothetical protein
MVLTVLRRPLGGFTDFNPDQFLERAHTSQPSGSYACRAVAPTTTIVVPGSSAKTVVPNGSPGRAAVVHRVDLV